ncbi:hypothetical protein BDV18DRAFT_85845 [Aspergillus unguis]
MLSCFPSQHAASGRRPGTPSRTESDRYRLSEPPRIALSSSQLIQTPAAAVISTPHNHLVELPAPGHQPVTFLVVRIVDAYIGEDAVSYETVRSQPYEKCLTAEIYYRGEMMSKRLSYYDALSASGGLEALAVFFVSYNPTPFLPWEPGGFPNTVSSLFSGLRSKWVGLRGWFGGSKRRSIPAREDRR